MLMENPLNSSLPDYKEKGFTNLMVIAARDYAPLIKARADEITDYQLQKSNYVDGKRASDYASKQGKKLLESIAQTSSDNVDGAIDLISRGDYDGMKSIFSSYSEQEKNEVADALSMDDAPHSQKKHDLFEFFLVQGVDPNIVLSYAAAFGDIDLVKQAVNGGAREYMPAAIQYVEDISLAMSEEIARDSGISLKGLNETLAYLRNLQ